MKSYYSSRDLSGILSISKQAILKRAQIENWECCEIPNGYGGGVQKRWSFEGLPEDVKIAVLCHHGEGMKDGHKALDYGVGVKKGPGGSNEITPVVRSKGHPSGITEMQKKLALARSDLVMAYVKHVKKAGHGLKQRARESFDHVYNSGYGYPELFKSVGKADWKTIERWKVLLGNSKDPMVLADRRGSGRNGKGLITEAQAKVIVPLICNPNGLRMSEVIRQAKSVMESRNITNGFSEDTYRRYITKWRETNLDHYTFWREGEHGMDEDVLPYLRRDWSRLEVGDVLVADGHILNGEAIHPETGKPKRMVLIVWYDMRSNYPAGWEIMPTENTQAISSALRRAILRLGKVPKVLYLDNGKAFRAKYFAGCPDFAQSGLTGLFERLGSKVIFTWPYHGQSKPIERFFGTFGEIERLCPAYTGTSIERKPPHLRRGEKLHARIHQKITGGLVPTIEDWHRAIASWIDTEYGVRPQKRTHLRGRCPSDVFNEGVGPGVDRDQLRLLMMHERITRVGRNGVRIRIDGDAVDFYDPELYGRSHSVMVRFDHSGLALGDSDSVLVYSEDGSQFICEAKRWDAVHPMAEIFGTDEEKARVREMLALKRHLKKQTIGSAREFVEAEVVPVVRRQCELIGFGGQRTTGGERTPERREIDISEEERLRIREGVEELERIRESIDSRYGASMDQEPEKEDLFDPEPLRDRYAKETWDELDSLGEADRYERLMELEVSGCLIPKRFLGFMRYFEFTEKFERRREYYQSMRQLFAARHVRTREGGE